MCTGSTHGINSAIYPKLNYDPLRDFIPVVTMTESTLYLAVAPSMPVASVAELVEYARMRPGKLNYGSPGLGSAHHLSGELLKARTGIDIVHVPFKGSAPALAALQAGEIQILFDSAALPHAKSGKIRILAVASRERWPASPEIPTVIEGGIPDFEARGWFGICVPAGTPMEVVERINRDANEVLREPETRKRLTDVGLRVAGGAQADMAAAIRRELAYWAAVVKASGAKVE
jgi:tripartite-type tricarboxylate transporter receptor subunit TctC